MSCFHCKAGDTFPRVYLLKSCLVTSFSACCCLTVQIRSEETVTRRHNTPVCPQAVPPPPGQHSAWAGWRRDLASPPEGGPTVPSRLVTCSAGQGVPPFKTGLCLGAHFSERRWQRE
uniref:Uncharacterized protein n=1 Tax=Anser brachyrhynchus TaxID=132585 RepID=A0A8B9CQN6_9AVES